MNDTFRIGRIAGVRVGVNWTVLVVLALIAYALAAGWLPHAYRGRHPLQYAAVGLLTGLAFLASLLLHELAHAIAARRAGLTVKGVTLWLFGGVSRFEGEPASPAAELRIAGSGVLASAAAGACCGAVFLLLPVVGVHGLAPACLGWLAAINLALAAFNALPAAPLDGSRLLHAVLWRIGGDRTRAALHAARTGYVFGWLVLIAGFVLSVRFSAGLWLVPAGWFMILSSGGEALAARMRAFLDGIPVGRIMTPGPFTVPAAMTVAEFRREMLPRHRHGAYPVLDGETVRGIVTAARVRDAPPEALLGDLAEDVTHTTPQTPLSALAPRLGRALVFDGPRLAGIVTVRDLAREVERFNRVAIFEH